MNSSKGYFSCRRTIDSPPQRYKCIKGPGQPAILSTQQRLTFGSQVSLPLGHGGSCYERQQTVSGNDLNQTAVVRYSEQSVAIPWTTRLSWVSGKALDHSALWAGYSPLLGLWCWRLGNPQISTAASPRLTQRHSGGQTAEKQKPYIGNLAQTSDIIISPFSLCEYFHDANILRKYLRRHLYNPMNSIHLIKELSRFMLCSKVIFLKYHKNQFHQ